MSIQSSKYTGYSVIWITIIASKSSGWCWWW